MIDVNVEKLIPLSQLPNHLPRRQRPDGTATKVSLTTVFRWALNGVRGVRLENVSVGGTRYTSEEALQRFTEALTAKRNGTPPIERAPASVRKRREEATKRLDTIGI